MTKIRRQLHSMLAGKATVVRGAEYVSPQPRRMGRDWNVIAGMAQRSDAGRARAAEAAPAERL